MYVETPFSPPEVPSLRLRYQTIEFGDTDIHVRTLRDTNQFDDDDGIAAALGISDAMWPLFGVIWESGRVLAELMVDFDIEGRHILEVGSGIGLASLVLNKRGADITATDQHPLADPFLQVNAKLNDSPPIPFGRHSWCDVETDLGLFDTIIGSDLLYDPGHAEDLAGFIDRHAAPTCEVLMVDGKRGHANEMTRRMEARGYAHTRRNHRRGDDVMTVQVHVYTRQAD